MTDSDIQILTPISGSPLTLCLIKRSDSHTDTPACVRRIIETICPGCHMDHDSHGAPYLTDSACHISISHCTSHIAVTFHPTLRHGVDVELPRQQLLRIRPRFLSSAELRHYTSLNDLLRAWTMKEAVYKAAAWPGLHLRHIILPLPGASCATLPDGRRFRITSFIHDGACITIAIPV
ncbi:MAG: 4'-phosphopantetheinyl transferase superfamily protein [Muribaculaceae bacterium]|nr:4'-phosphopantetheinyl transferase superfamily protein [Muribaculaceae bacterium]